MTIARPARRHFRLTDAEDRVILQLAAKMRTTASEVIRIALTGLAHDHGIAMPTADEATTLALTTPPVHE